MTDNAILLLDHVVAGAGAADAPAAGEDELVLPFEARQKARQRVTLQSGRAAGLKLPRGTVLRGGSRLGGPAGARVRVVAAAETVSIVRACDARSLARAAYHLGNRHVWVQVGDGWLRYLHDHVLDAMLRGLGLTVTVEQAPFEPEAGAYDSGHSHSHDHDQTGAHHHHAHGRGRIHESAGSGA